MGWGGVVVAQAGLLAASATCADTQMATDTTHTHLHTHLHTLAASAHALSLLSRLFLLLRAHVPLRLLT